MVQTLSGTELSCTQADAALLGLLASGCRLYFVTPTAAELKPTELRRLRRRLGLVGGRVVVVQDEMAAARMTAGAALRGVKAAAVVVDGMAAAHALSGLDDLPTAILDVSGRLPLTLPGLRTVLAPHTVQTAFHAGLSLLQQTAAFHGPGLVAGLSPEAGLADMDLPEAEAGSVAPPPIHHDGPDDPEILLLGAGASFAACLEARERLEAEGHACAHLHLLQIAPFPGAIMAPALTSSRRILVVETGGPGTLAGLLRSHLGAPVTPFGELPRLAGAPVTADEIAWRAREVSAL